VAGESEAAPWAAGEVVRLLVDVGTALERLHGAGRAHGGLGSAAAWEVGPTGGVVLVSAGDGSGSPARDVDQLAGTALGLLGRLPGECRTLAVGTSADHPGPDAPRSPGPVAAPHADVRGWEGEDAADEVVSGGLVPRVPDCPDDDVPRERLRHVLLLATARPGATPIGLLVTQALAVADPVPVHRPDPGTLVRDALVRGAAAPPASVGRARHRRRGPARGVLAAGGAGVAVLVLGLAVLAAPFALGERVGGAGVTAGGAAPGLPPVLAAADPRTRLEGDVVLLTRSRAAALADGDLLRLLRVTVPGSPAALADLDRYARLHGPAAVPAGDREPGSASATPGASVAIRTERVSVLAADEEGARVLLVAAVGPAESLDVTPSRGVVLSVTDRAGTWRVQDVAAAPSDAP
jgi:hypothetical protein